MTWLDHVRLSLVDLVVGTSQHLALLGSGCSKTDWWISHTKLSSVQTYLLQHLMAFFCFFFLYSSHSTTSATCPMQQWYKLQQRSSVKTPSGIEKTNLTNVIQHQSTRYMRMVIPCCNSLTARGLVIFVKTKDAREKPAGSTLHHKILSSIWKAKHFLILLLTHICWDVLIKSREASYSTYWVEGASALVGVAIRNLSVLTNMFRVLSEFCLGTKNMCERRTLNDFSFMTLS